MGEFQHGALALPQYLKDLSSLRLGNRIERI
jgi:hypothetical protein